MKKFKSIITLFMSLILVVTIMSTSVIASTTYEGNGTPISNKTELTYIDVEKDGIGGKGASDAYYKVDVACTAKDKSFVLNHFANNLECQFMLPTAEAAMQIRMIMHGTEAKGSSGNHSYVYVEVNVNDMSFNYKNGSSAAWGSKWKENINLVPGRWYTLVAKFADLAASSGEQEAEYYINGELIYSGIEVSNLYGIRNWALGPKSADHPIYVDNIITSNGRGITTHDKKYVPDVERWTPSVITETANGIVLDNEGGKLTVEPETTVADVLSNLSTSDSDDVVNVYNSDLKTLANPADYAFGKVVVVAAKNGQSTAQAYKYYDIEEVEYDAEIGEGKNASDLHISSGTYTVTSMGSVFGKAYHDEAYKVERVVDGEGISIANTFFNKNTVGASYGYFRCQFALEEGSTLIIHMAYNPNAGDYVRINIDKGCTSLGSKKENVRSAPIEEGKWHTLVITGPVTDNKHATAKVYIDGELVRTHNLDEVFYGMRRPFINMVGTVYLDNIEVRKADSYDPYEDAYSWLNINNAIAKGEKIYYTNMPTASDFNPAASTKVRFYDANWNRLADTEGAEYVVVGEKDTLGREANIKYYTFDSSAKDYIAGGYYDKDNNFYVKAYGKNAGDSLYYATYESANNDELSEVVAGVMNTADNKAEISGTFGDKPYRFFFWDKDINPLVKSIALELKK